MKHTLQSRALWIGILACAAAGAYASGALLEHQANIWGNTSHGIFNRVCQATATLGMDCAHTADSRWSAIPVPAVLPAADGWDARWLRVPVAFLGLAYFTMLAIWYAVTGLPRGDRWSRAVGGLVLAGAFVSGFYLVVMATQLAPLCVWCVAVHLLNLTLVAAQRRLHRLTLPAPAPANKCQPADAINRESWCTRDRRAALSALAFSLVIIAGMWLYRRDHLAMGQQIQNLRPYREIVTALRADPDFLRREYYAQPLANLPPNRAAQGRAELVIFTDYTCAACACNAQRLQNQIIPAFNGDLHVTIRHFPLTLARGGADDPRDPGLLAARAAEAARLQGGAPALEHMHDLLFAHRHAITHQRCIDLAIDIGLNPERFRRDLAGEAVHRAIERDVALARELGVTAVPTLFLNNRRVTTLAVDNPVFWEAIAADFAASHLRMGARP